MFGALIGGLIMGVLFVLVIWGLDLFLNSRNSKSPSDYELSAGQVAIAAIAISVVTGLIFAHSFAWMIGSAFAIYFGFRFLYTKVWGKA